jgi:hypothetical protein
VENYGTVRGATYDNIIRSMLFALWITNAADKHTEYVIVLLTHGEGSSVLGLQLHSLSYLIFGYIKEQVDNNNGGNEDDLYIIKPQ